MEHEMRTLKINVVFFTIATLGNEALSVLLFMEGKMIDGVISAFFSLLGVGVLLYVIYKLLWMMGELKDMKIHMIFIGLFALGTCAFSLWSFIHNRTIAATIFAFISSIATWNLLYILKKKERTA